MAKFTALSLDKGVIDIYELCLGSLGSCCHSFTYTFRQRK